MRLLKNPSVLPGFNLNLESHRAVLSLLVVLPFAMMAAKAGEIGWAAFLANHCGAQCACGGVAEPAHVVYAMLTNIVFGTLVAWVLVRYEFPGKI